jgi:hypothetical protein
VGAIRNWLPPYDQYALRAIALFIFCLCLLPSSAAQEIEGNGKSGGALISPSAYTEIVTPLTNRLSVDSYGFYFGHMRAGMALEEAPVSVQKHFMVTPSYLFISIPPSGVSLVTSTLASETYHENQVRLAGTVATTWHHFTLSDRNMYVRRFTPFGELNRYRNRPYLDHPLSFGPYTVTAFVYDEIFHDFAPGKWLRRNLILTGINMPINRHLIFQPSYLRFDDSQLRSVNFLSFGLIIHTGLLHW